MSAVNGTGPGGRVTKLDVESAHAATEPPAAAVPQPFRRRPVGDRSPESGAYEESRCPPFGGSRPGDSPRANSMDVLQRALDGHRQRRLPGQALTPDLHRPAGQLPARSTTTAANARPTATTDPCRSWTSIAVTSRSRANPRCSTSPQPPSTPPCNPATDCV
ncbi:E3 binding domain-containing protein [Nocardia goodfellowii]